MDTIRTLALGFVVVLYIRQQALGSRTPHPLPPGPRGLPWFGNIIGVNTEAPWITYAEWAKTYGDLVHSRLLGKDIIIINSEKIAKDLLENRSRIYSGRPYFMTNELCGLGFNTVFMPYGDRWRLQRRFFHQTFRADAVTRFLPYQYLRACHLLRRLLDKPEQLEDHIFEYTAAVIMNGTYDYDPASRNDQLVEIVANLMTTILPILRPDTATIIGAFPWLLRLPSWFPGMSFKKEMEVARVYSKQYLERPFEYALQKVESIYNAPSMVHDALQQIEEKNILPEESWMEELKAASGTAFLAASETSNSVIMSFFLMMMVNPAAQKTAQAQIDAVVGNDRLPTMEDRPLLPFVDAILRETLRYSPVGPLAIPHATVDNDTYDGFHIPKGESAMVLVNLWSMAHNESKYPNSDEFIPERFLNDDGSLKPNDIEHLAYGYGRRVCPGRHFADTSVWAVIAKVLAVFNVLRPLDENGVEMPVEPKFSNGISIHPLPFKYRIVPRFPEMGAEKLEQLIAADTV